MITNSFANENQALKGIHRSRFSFHFNFFHRRRWLLVQLVTAPAIPAVEEATTPTYNYSNTENHRGLTNSFEEYSFNRMPRACV